jgi:transcription elongation factor GreA
VSVRPLTAGTLLTPEGFRALSEELAELVGARRREVAEELRRASDLAGDLGDNLEYLEARREQQQLEQRIATVEARLRTAEVVEPGARGRGVADLGCEVRVEDVETGAREKYRLVGSPETAPAEGRISIESPVGQALLGRRRGDLVEVEAPRRRRKLRITGVGRG